MCIEIHLSNGGSTFVSDQDADVSTYSWSGFQVNPGKIYASRRVNGRTIYLHRELLKPPVGLYVDHINGDGLDNRRENLRLATGSQNAVNRKPTKALSGYRGVHRNPRNPKWSACLMVAGRNIRRGSFDDPAEAARLYDKLAVHYFGEFAVLNFPEEA